MNITNEYRVNAILGAGFSSTEFAGRMEGMGLAAFTGAPMCEKWEWKPEALKLLTEQELNSIYLASTSRPLDTSKTVVIHAICGMGFRNEAQKDALIILKFAKKAGSDYVWDADRLDLLDGQALLELYQDAASEPTEI